MTVARPVYPPPGVKRRSRRRFTSIVPVLSPVEHTVVIVGALVAAFLVGLILGGMR